MKNILLFLKNLKNRGVSKVYINLAYELKRKGYNVHIVIREHIIDFDTKDLNIIIFDKNITSKVDSFIKEKKIDFIISNNVSYLTNLKNISQEKIYYSVHMLWGERIFKNLRFRKLFELKREYTNKNVIAVSKAVKKDLLERIKIKPKKIKVIYDVFDFREIEEKSVEKIEIDNEYILNVGAFSKEKNHKLLIDIFKDLKLDLKLVLIGSGKLENKIRNYVKKKNLENKVIFLGFKQNPYPYIKNAKLTLLTSTNEALPGVAIESLYLNTPVVSTDSIGIREILTDDLKNFIGYKKSDLIEKIYLALENYPLIYKEKLIQKFNKIPVDEYISLIEGY